MELEGAIILSGADLGLGLGLGAWCQRGFVSRTGHKGWPWGRYRICRAGSSNWNPLAAESG